MEALWCTVPHREKTLPRIQKHFPEGKILPRIQKHVLESKTRPRIQKHFPESKSGLDSGKCFWVLGRVLIPTSHRTDELWRWGSFLPSASTPLGTGGGGCTYKEEYPWLKYSSYFHSFEQLCTTEYPPTFSEHISRRICVYCEGRGYESPLVQTV